MASCTALQFPNEILVIIINNLTCRDLKALRLVCQHWSALTVDRLFKRIYVSRRSQDIQNFHCIASHDVYRKAVRTLFYNSSDIPERVWSDPLIKAYPKSAYQNIEYKALMRAQHLATIIQGLKSLPYLEEVVAASSPLHQSPVSRSWPRAHLSSKAIVGSSFLENEGVFETKSIYDNSHYLLIRALSQSGRKINRFITDVQDVHGVPLRLFDTDSMTERRCNFLEEMCDVYSGLKSLTLVISLGAASSNLKYGEDGLQWFLEQMPKLVDLSLTFRGNSLVRCQFPFIPSKFMLSGHTWYQLQHLTLSGAMVEENPFLKFLQRHSLRSFTMGRLKLIGDSWVPTLAAIQNSVPKIEHIVIRGPLYQRSGRDDPWDIDSEDDYGEVWSTQDEIDDLKERVAAYVSYDTHCTQLNVPNTPSG